MIGVEVAAITTWELGKKEPKVSYLPAILGFLGYDPIPKGETLGEQLRNERRRRGLTQVRLARRLGVSQQTITKLETGETTRDERVLAVVLEFLREGG
jgi:transcriptional regulator with XRE-family HTH domain